MTVVDARKIAQIQTITKMMAGFENLETHFLKNPLQPHQQEKLQQVLFGIEKYREYRDLTNGIFEKPKISKDALNLFQGYTLRTRGSEELLGREGYYLRKSEIEQFEKRGILGPYNLLSRQEAQDLHRFCYKNYENDFDNGYFLCDEAVNVLKKHNMWNIDYSGRYQVLRYKPFWDILISKEITQRLASLLGENVICWRNEFFEKKPGTEGTLWHQQSRFKQLTKPILEPTVNVDPGIIQLTVWIALTDVRIKNGCMRMIPGSFADGRFEQLFYDMLDNLMSYAVDKEKHELEKIIKTLMFPTGPFSKAQLLFEVAMSELEDFAFPEVKDLEMDAGDFIIFTSFNLHASHPNTTEDQTRLALAGRYTNNDVKVHHENDRSYTPEGGFPFLSDRLGCIQAHGTDHYKHNKIIPYPW
ncbi:phytanoyl-CoA dioxygenase family protein [Scytonema sp. PCC 10023]|uniref:phytanoyl-CoA dioxygenase family protein n=1 Tax=Scytonema sp. PCC 10023 TaxID=1680591 RepID=UPI0039C5D493